MTPDSAIAGFMHRVCRSAYEPADGNAPAADQRLALIAAARSVIESALAAGKSWLDPAEAGIILRDGIPIIAIEALEITMSTIAASIGFPVALRSSRPISGIRPMSAVSPSASVTPKGSGARQVQCLSASRAVRPEARLEGFLLQPTISRPEAVELLVGLIDDPVFGPVVAFGQGGTAVEGPWTVRSNSPLNVLLAPPDGADAGMAAPKATVAKPARSARSWRC